MYDIIIIGAGPAGLTAALYALRAKKNILILEATVYGGQVINIFKLENYPSIDTISGVDFANNLYEQIKKLNGEVKFERVINIQNNDNYKEVITSKNTYKAKSIIIATGNKNKLLGLENEQKLIGKGISYCATCDGAFFKDQDVAIVGGGNSALEDALYLSNICRDVYLIHHGNELKANQDIIDKVKEKENIKLIFNSNVSKLNGKEKLTSIEIINKNNLTKEIIISGLFVDIGKIPENEIFRTIINLDDKGYIIASEDCKTNINGIFVAGDARKKTLRQIVTAISDGAISATEAIKYLNK